MNNDNALMSFLKKNAALSTGARSNQRNSDIDSFRDDPNRNFYAPNQFSSTPNYSRDNNNFENNSIYSFSRPQQHQQPQQLQPSFNQPLPPSNRN